MTLNTFDSDGQCGYNRDWDSAGADPNLAFVPDDRLYFNSVDIRGIVDRVDKLDVHMFGPQDVKYRYWKIDDIGLDRNGNAVSCGESFLGRIDRWKLFHDDKLYWNGYRSAVDNCATEDITQFATVTKNTNRLLFDFGEGNKYAVTSITQDTDAYSGIVKYFSVYASNDNSNWEKICTFEGVPDPRARVNPTQAPPPAGTPTPHCLIVREDTNNFYPTKKSNLDTGVVSKTETHAQKLVIRDMKLNLVQAANIHSKRLEMELWADGLLFEYGTQYRPVKNVTSLVEYSGISGNTGNFKEDDYLVYSAQRGAYTIAFPPDQPQNITSIRFRSGSSSYQAYPTSFTVDFYNDCDALIKTVMFDSDHVVSELDSDLGLAGSGNTLDYGKHFVLLETAQGESIFPGNAARMWKPPIVETGGGGGGLWEFDTVIKTAGFTASPNTYYLVDPNAGYGTLYVDLPENPPDKTVVGVRQINPIFGGFNVAGIQTTDGSSIEGGGSSVLLEQFTLNQKHVGVVYSESANSWYVFIGNIEGSGGIG